MLFMHRFLRIFFIPTTLLLMFGWASKSYFVNVYDFSNSEDSELEKFQSETRDTMHVASGRMLGRPLMIINELQSPSTPEYTSAFQGDVHTLEEFSKFKKWLNGTLKINPSLISLTRF